MTTVWSRWLLGAWAVATAVWVMAATLMLVQTVPGPAPRGAEGALVGDGGPASGLGQAMRGQAGGGIASSGRQRVGMVLLILLLPPGLLLVLVLGGMRLAGLPLPSLRQAARGKPS